MKNEMLAAMAGPAMTGVDDDNYEGFLNVVRVHFAEIASHAMASSPRASRLFMTDAVGLFDAFLAVMPVERRQHYTCRACRNFVERFGGLVLVDSAGQAFSAFWEPGRCPCTSRLRCGR